MNCLHCGAPVLINGVCTECGLQQEYLIKAWNTSLYYYNEGLKFAKMRNLTGAENSLQTSLRYNKANIDARNLLGLVYYETGQVVEALAQWVISSNYQPDQNPATRYLRIVQGNQNKLDAYDQAARKYNLTLHYVKQKNTDLALIQLKRVISDNPHFVKAYLVLALIYIQQGNVERAKKALKRVLKIDRYNPDAQHYLAELQGNERQYAQDVSYLSNYDEEDEVFPDVDGENSGSDEEDEVDSEEIARRRIREIIERGAAADEIASDQNLEVGSYQEIKYGKHNVLYLAAGLTIGIVAMFFLVMPARVRHIKNENLDLKSSYSAELAGKNAQIANMEENEAALQQQIADLNAEMANMKQDASGSNVNDTVMQGVQLYLNGDKEGAIRELGAMDLTRGDLSDATKGCIQAVANGCDEELASYRSAGMTAFGAENYDEAVDKLQIYCNLKIDDPEARYNLAKAYELKGEVQLAGALYQDINTRFPDSEYTSTLFQ